MGVGVRVRTISYCAVYMDFAGWAVLETGVRGYGWA